MASGPTGKAVVTDVQHAARQEVASGKFGDKAVIVAAYPGPDAVQADAIERGQVVAREQLLEAVVIQTEIAAGVARHADCVRGMGGVEVGADVLARVGSRIDVDGHSLTKAQFAMGSWLARIVQASPRSSRQKRWKTGEVSR